MHVNADHHLADRRSAITRLLRGGGVRKQADLVRLLKAEGHAVTQSSVSRDLREIGVLKAADGYVLPGDEAARPAGNFATLAAFVRGLRVAGPSLAVLKTHIGGAQSVALAIDQANWPEVVGTISGDDTIFIATAGARDQAALVKRLRSHFNV
ncbi:MAG: arginine repressor [Steroidobacteraceae bacterium]